LEKCIQDAVAGLGRADDPNVPLLALCLWNAPNLGIMRKPNGDPLYPVTDKRQRQAVARYWLDPDLGEKDQKHANNLMNYQEALNYVRAGGYLHDVSEDTGVPTTMPDITDYTPPTLPPITVNVNRESNMATVADAITELQVAVKDLQARFLVLDRQQHMQTDGLGIVANPMYGPGTVQNKLGPLVSALRGGTDAAKPTETATDDTQDDEQPPS
jgi:hypothetical protein